MNSKHIVKLDKKNVKCKIQNVKCKSALERIQSFANLCVIFASSAIQLTALLFCLSTFQACEEKTDWQLHPGQNNKLVVDAILTNEFKTQEIRLSLSTDEINVAAPPVSGAIVLVRRAQNTIAFFESSEEAGTYRSEEAFFTQMFENYRLEIEWEGQNYEAENQMVRVTPIPPLSFRAYGKTDSLVLEEVAPLFDPNEDAMYELDIDWSNITGVNSSRAKLFFYTFSTVDVSELIRPAKEMVVFPKGSIIIEKKYSLNDDFAAFYRALLLETEWQGGVADEASSSLPSNISNGGLGFFGVSAVRSDTLIAE